MFLFSDSVYTNRTIQVGDGDKRRYFPQMWFTIPGTPREAITNQFQIRKDGQIVARLAKGGVARYGKIVAIPGSFLIENVVVTII
jgi:hypothetical protein